MSRLKLSEQIKRFGMSFEDACLVRDRVQEKLSKNELEASRKAWQDLSYELRGNRCGPFLCSSHPEAVRFSLLKALDEGHTLPRAVEIAREFSQKDGE